jgi:NADH dehydrogenase
MSEIPHVVVIGAGFGGLRAVRALEKAPVQITLIDRNNYHLFQPLLYQVATSGLAPEDIAYPVRAILQEQKNAGFLMAEVKQVDVQNRQVVTDTQMIGYDYLILAVGSQNHYFGMETVERHSMGLKSVSDAIIVRNHILRMFELAEREPDPAVRQAMLTFVIAGGGPTGVESAGTLSELIRLVLVKDYPQLNLQDVRVLLVEGTNRVLAVMPEELSKATAVILRQKNVEVRFNSLITQFDGKTIVFKDGTTIEARTLLWAAGVRAADLTDKIGVKQAGPGRIMVAPTLQIPGYPEVFVIGDAAYIENQPLPMNAPAALQQGDAAAGNVRRLMNGSPLLDFTYKDLGSMAAIGRNAAVASLGRWRFSGFLAWITWLFVHIVQLIGFRNRLIVLMNWAWDYFFFEKAVRLIIPKCDK